MSSTIITDALLTRLAAEYDEFLDEYLARCLAGEPVGIALMPPPPGKVLALRVVDLRPDPRLASAPDAAGEGKSHTLPEPAREGDPEDPTPPLPT